MASCLIGRGVSGVVVLRGEGQGDVGDLAPRSALFRPVHREGGELIDFGFARCQHQTPEVGEVRHRIRGCAKPLRSEEHTSELQSLMRISYAVFCLKKKTNTKKLSTNRMA